MSGCHTASDSPCRTVPRRSKPSPLSCHLDPGVLRLIRQARKGLDITEVTDLLELTDFAAYTRVGSSPTLRSTTSYGLTGRIASACQSTLALHS